MANEPTSDNQSLLKPGETLGSPVTEAAQPDIGNASLLKPGETLGTPVGHPDQGPTIGPQGNNANLHPEDMSSDPFTRVGMKMTTPFARKAMDAVDKLREVENFTKEGEQAHPVQAFMGHIANKLEGFLFGNEAHPEAGIGTGKEGMLTNPVTSSLIPGAGGTPMLAEGLESGANAIKEGVSALRGGKAAEKAPGIVKQVMQGKNVAQEPAKAAIRGAVGADEDAALLEGHKSVIDEHLQGIQAQEKAAYQKMDESAGFDVKETKAKLRDAEYKVKQPEIDDAARERLNKTITESKQSIADAEKKMTEGGIDPKAADKLHTQRMAGQEFRKALVRNMSEDGESVNVDGLLKAVKNLRNMSKYGDRAEQFLGKQGADDFVDQLQKAQDLGAHGLKVQQVAKMVGKWVAGGLVGGAAAGAGYEVLK